MGTYAEIVNDTIVNIIVATEDWATAHNLSPVPSGAGVGWITTDGGSTWTAPPPPPPTPVEAATTNVQQAASALSAGVADLENATSTIQAIPASSALSTTQIAALDTVATGVLDVVKLIADFVVATGVVPPPDSTPPAA